MSEIISYLKHLEFDKKMEHTLHGGYVKNVRLVFLILFVILAIGITSLFVLPRRLNPEINLTIVQVMTVLPGAGPEDVESLVTIPLEEKLIGIKGLDTITSSSQDNVSVIAMQFVSNTDKDKARNDVQNAVNEVTDLPTDAKTPKVSAFDFENQSIWTFTLTGSTDYASLMRYAKDFQKKIKDIPNVDSVTLSGYDTQEIQIVMNQEKIRQYGISPLVVSQAIKTATQAYPAGQVDTGSSTLALAIESQAVSVQGLRDIELTINNKPVKLGELADVSTRSKLNQQRVLLARPGYPPVDGVTFSVFKTSSADIDKTVREVEAYVHNAIHDSSGKFQVHTLVNSGEDINKQFTDLVGEFQSTLVLVFINLFLFLGLRQALIAIMTIPLTFLLSFFWMNVFGISVNYISLFALLLAFGTSIDDTIVTVSAMTSYYRTGKFTPLQTGLLVWRDFIVPIWTTTVTTVWAFLPLILSTGIIGEFIKPIPIVVATTMYSSTFVAWFITLPLMIVLLKPDVPKRIKLFVGVIGLIAVCALLFAISPKNIVIVPIFAVFILLLYVTNRIRHTVTDSVTGKIKSSTFAVSALHFTQRLLSRGIINTEPLGRMYHRIIRRILSSAKGRRITLVCILSFTIGAYMLIPLGLVRNEFFPKTNGDIIYVTDELPSGSDIRAVDRETQELLRELTKTPRIISVVAQTQSRAPTQSGSAGTNSILFTLNLIPKETRDVTSSDITEGIRHKFASYTRGRLSVSEISGGPPAGADIQIKLSGDELSVLDQYADKIIIYLKTKHGLTNIDKSIRGGTSKIVFTPDQAKLSANGISVDSLGLWLRTYASGFNFNQVKFDNDTQDVTFYTNYGSQNPQSLGQISVPTQNGSVPLITLGSFTLKNNPTVITREAGKRTMSVSAGVLPGYSVSAINADLEKYASNGLALPDNYSWKTGGVNEENQKSVASIFRAMGLSFLLIMATMVVEFGSYRQAAMILSLIPFAISGVFIIFGLTGTPLSFPALIGVLALFGVVVTNAMFIVEKINQNRKGGMKIIDAIADAGESRLEPIMLTSITSILGLVPITLANALWRGLGGAIISGLLFSGIIMLFFIPVMYFMFYNKEEK